MIDNRNIFLI